MRFRVLRSWFYILPITAAVAWACTQGVIPATGERRFVGFSWEQEQEIGREVSQEIAALFGIYQDDRLQAYVERVGRRVLAESHLRRAGAAPEFRNSPITFRVLDSPVINAMALPGGYVYVTRGLLAHLNSEDQLAVVLGHEIGHVTARHAARRAWQQQLGQGILFGGALLGQGVLGVPAEQIFNLGGAAAQLIFLRHSREDELESDKLAVEYALLAGYNPREAGDFFRSLSRIQEKEGQGLPSFLSTHPDPGDRERRLEQLAGARGRSADTRPSEEYFRAIEGMVLGEDPRQGFVERDVFYHPDLRFRFPIPAGFRVINQPAQVVMIEKQKRAFMGFTSTKERSVEAAASGFASQRGLRILERSRARSGELPAATVLAEAQTQNGQVVRLLAYFVEHRGRVYQFVAYTSPQAFGNFRKEFLETMRGFGEVDDPRILRRQPVRLDVERASRSVPFQVLIPRQLPAEMKPEDLAILNQVRLNEEITRGRLVKLPRVS